jgi:hypothetical protein
MVLWAFGLATTLLLVGLWGRAVTHDAPTVQEAARSALDAGVASDRIYSWIEEAVAMSTDVDPATAEEVLSALREHPEVEAAVADVVDEFIGALFTAEDELANIELAEPLAPIVPLVALEFAARGAPIDEAALTMVLQEAETVGLGTGDIATAVRIVDDAQSLLSLLVVLAASILLLTGTFAVWLSENRLATLRMLATRIVFSALSFAILFRVGSWALDPDRGGSPIAGSGSVLLGSNTDVFFLVGIASAVVTVGIGWILWRRRRNDGASVHRYDAEADTRELVSI